LPYLRRVVLVGNNLTFNGAVVTAENGRIDIGSVQLGTELVALQNKPYTTKQVPECSG